MEILCNTCNAPFEHSDEARAFLENVAPEFSGRKESIPPPTLCPSCREQRRATHINELFLYKRQSDFTGNDIISNFHPTSPYKVFEQEHWYSDAWDPLPYGRPFDFFRPFFAQYQELSLAVPRPSLLTGYQYDENCSYTNYAGKNKNCYLIFDSDENRDCYFSYSINGCVNCLDCYRVRKSELCYECIDCTQCYRSQYLQDCNNCSDSMFLKNCNGCRSCIFSSNLNNKEYHVFNKAVTKEEFEEVKHNLESRGAIEKAKEEFEKYRLQFPQKYMHGLQNENAVGDYLLNSKNARQCFDGEDLWDCTYAFQSFMPLKNCMDTHESGDGELLYECSCCGYSAHHMLFSANCLDQFSDVYYSTFCMHCSDIFGCVGLRRKRHCILNVQYTKDEYEALVPKIIEHMRKTKEWGEFFPMEHSPFAYNEMIGFDRFPLSRSDALARGLTWRDDDPKEMITQSYTTPDTIAAVKEDVTGEVLQCENCHKNYRIIAQELAFYRDINAPLPRCCFLCRNKERSLQRNPWTLWTRSCANCGKDIQTSYDPNRPEIVYCEECYLKMVY